MTKQKISPRHRKLIAAIDLGIKALEHIRQRRYSPGHVAFLNGHDFDFAIRDHQSYVNYTNAIEELTMKKLEYILDDMLQEAKAKAGTKIRRKLPNGLGIETTCNTSQVRLTITRDTTYPSTQEWDTVAKYFPFPIPTDTEVIQTIKDNRYIITAKFQLQKVSQLKFA